MTIRLQSLTTNKLENFRELLRSSDFGGCFCAVWTAQGADWESRCADPAMPNYHATAQRVQKGEHVGYFVYENDTLVGWTGSGPKNCFPLLASKLGSRLSASSQQTWSIGCIAVKTEFRGRGLADKIVAAVLGLAQRNLATHVEAYPVRPFHEPRIYRGTEGLYRRMGFFEAGFEHDGEHQILLMIKSI